MQRRDFLLWLSLGGLWTLGPAGCRRPADKQAMGATPPAPPAEAERPAPEQLTFFSAREARTARAMLERLLPSDGPLPGAKEAGVLNYVDRQLSLPHFQGLERMMRTGIEYVDRLSMRAMKLSFHELDAAAQDTILEGFQTGSHRGMRFPQARFFSRFHSFALEGYLGDPRHGGNFDRRAWRALGIDPTCHNMFERCN